MLIPQLSAVFPDTIAIGRRTTLVVLGIGTSFDTSTVFSAGANLTVHSTAALSPTALRVEVTADSSATAGARTVTLTQGALVLTLPGGLTLAPGARGTLTAGTLAQGGAVTVRIEVTSGKTFTPTISGGLIVPLSTSVAGAGFTVVQTRWVNSTTIDATALISPLATTMTPPSLTVTFDDASTAVVPLAGNIAPTAPLPLPTASAPGNLGLLRGAVYSVAVSTAPLRLNLTTTATGTPVWTPRTRIFDATGALLGDGATATSAVASSNGTYFVAVNDALGASPNATFTLASSTTALSANSVCTAATPLVVGTPITGETIGTGGIAPTGCLASASGPVRYYAVTVPAGEGVTVRVTPTGFDANLRAVDSCASSTCVASIDSSVSTTGSEPLTLRNPTGASATFQVAVGSSSSTTSGTYTLVATRQAYAISSVAPACEDMTSATALLAATGTTPVISDDSTTPALALPIAFSYFGTPVAFYSANTNGFVQLNALTFTPSSTFTNSALPNTATPNSVVAAFWDDHNITPAVTTSRVSTLTVGTAPTRTLVVEWFDITGRAQNERLRFQAKFVEADNSIEFHYCSLVANAGSATYATGELATVGLDNATGTDTGLQWSFNTAGAVGTSSALRFTPVP